MGEGAESNAWDFAAAVTGVLLSWPVIVLVIVLLVLKPLRELIPRLKSYEGLGQKVAFGDQLAAAEETAAAAVEGEPRPEPETEPSPLLLEAEQNPSFVVISAWEQLSASLRRAGEWLELAPITLRSAKMTAELLRQSRWVNDEFVQAVDELRNLRNRVAHGQHKPTPGEAVTYAETANELVQGLHSAIRRRHHNVPPMDERPPDEGD